MLNRLFLALCAVSLLAACGRSSETSQSDTTASQNVPDSVNTLTAAERSAGWRLLFDGTTTDGWRNYKADTLSSKWRVEHGALTLTGGGGGDIITTEKFGSFELKVEWKISECGNSGLLFHAIEEGHDIIWRTAPEVQILDNTCHEDAEDPTHRAGANYDLHAPSNDVTKPAGEWNELRLVVDNGHVEHHLNGTKIVEYDLWTDAWRQKVDDSKFRDMPDYGTARSGYIGLQDHSDRVWFRDIKIRELNDASSANT